MIAKNGFRSSAPDRQCQPTARSQDAAGLGESCHRVGQQHVPEPAEDSVDRVVVELNPLGVEDPVVDVRQTELRAAPTRGVEHRGREVAGD
jgi:hypothetical protein